MRTRKKRWMILLMVLMLFLHTEEEASRALKTLRSSKAPLVKKRQVMRAMAGDYRKKMEDESKKQYKLIQSGKRQHIRQVQALKCYAVKCIKATLLSNRNGFSSSQNNVGIPKEVCFPPESCGQTSDVCHGRAVTATWFPNDQSGCKTFCLHLVQGGLSL